MGDFHQNGYITTFHNLVNRPTPEIEYDLQVFQSRRPMGLVLPSLYSELEGPALKHIIDELAEVPYLDEIVIGLDRATKKQYKHALKFFSKLPQRHRVLWNDGPRLKAIDAELQEHQLAPKELGKGRNVWYCLGYIISRGRAQAVALHDCDILTYDRGLLARLIYPVANPGFNYQFCKGYYARVAEGKLNGRVTRLLVSPLIQALKKTIGTNDYLNYMDCFRYPLAGEFSFRSDVIPDLRIPSDWGLEIGIISEIQRNYNVSRICQVDVADIYDHKHQPVSLEDKNKGLSKMSIDISKAFFRKLATNGVTFSQETIRTIKATYFRVALDYLETYQDEAEFNGLQMDIHAEESAVELFAENVFNAGLHFLDNPMETPFMPTWNRVSSAMPDVLGRIKHAVEEDMQEFSG